MCLPFLTFYFVPFPGCICESAVNDCMNRYNHRSVAARMLVRVCELSLTRHRRELSKPAAEMNTFFRELLFASLTWALRLDSC